MSNKVQQSVCSDCVTYAESRIDFNNINTFINVTKAIARIHLPYVPRGNGRQGRPRKHKYSYNISYTVQMRGDEMDIPFLLFHGAPRELLQETCTELCRLMNENLKDIVLTEESSCRRKNGKCFWRYALQVCELNTDFLSLDGLIDLLVYKLKGKADCEIKSLSLHRFLNQ